MVIIKGEIGVDATLLDIVCQVQNDVVGDTIRVLIDSPGGIAEEGIAIYEYLRGLNRKVVTECRNMCASIASVIFMAGDERVAGCDIMIHNPFLGDVYAPFLSQKDLKDAWEYLEEIKNRICSIYQKNSGISKQALLALMEAETWISPEQAVNVGIATSAKNADANAAINTITPLLITTNERVNRAINLLSNQKEFKMKKMTLTERIKNFLAGKIKNVDYSDKDGNAFQIEIPSDRESQMPEVGDAGSPDGTYTMEDGTIITIADGVVTEITTPKEDTETMDSLRAEIENLKAENAQFRSLLEAANTELEAANTELEGLRAEKSNASKVLNTKRDFRTSATEKLSPLEKAIEQKKKEIAEAKAKASK